MLMNVCWFLSAAAMAAAGVRLLLLRGYPFAAFYCSVAALSSIIRAAAGSPQSRSYLSAWVATDPILQVALLLAAAEAFSLFSGQFPKLGRIGAWLLGVTTAAGLGFALVFADSDLAAVRDFVTPAVKVVFLTHRWAASIALIMLGLSVLFLTRFRRPIAPNVYRHVIILLFYLGINSAATLALFVGGKQSWQLVNVVELGLSAMCGFAWVLGLRRKGEHVERTGSLEALDSAWRDRQTLIQGMRSRD